MNRQLFEYEPTFAYRFIPGLKARVDHEGGGYLLRTNAQGFRCNHDFDAPKSDGIYRVLLFGDSYTAGDGVRSTTGCSISPSSNSIPKSFQYSTGVPS